MVENISELNKINYDNYSQILSKIITFFKNNDLYKLHRLDELLLEESLVSKNDQKLIELTIIAYTLRKLSSKKHITSNIKWKEIKEKIIVKLEFAKDSFKKDIKQYDIAIDQVINLINNTDKLLGYFITHIISKSRAKIASSVYGYGLSLSKACSLLNAKKKDVMDIVGSTKIPDEDDEIKSIKERIAYISDNLSGEKVNK